MTCHGHGAAAASLGVLGKGHCVWGGGGAAGATRDSVTERARVARRPGTLTVTRNANAGRGLAGRDVVAVTFDSEIVSRPQRPRGPGAGRGTRLPPRPSLALMLSWHSLPTSHGGPQAASELTLRQADRQPGTESG